MAIARLIVVVLYGRIDFHSSNFINTI